MAEKLPEQFLKLKTQEKPYRVDAVDFESGAKIGTVTFERVAPDGKRTLFTVNRVDIDYFQQPVPGSDE